MSRQLWSALGALFLFYLGLACLVPLMDDEVYYWCWAREPQLSYFDHPPMVAYLIWASTGLFGDSALALRLPACLGMTVVAGVALDLTRPRKLLLWVLVTPLFTFGAVLVTPDTPLLLFWSLYLRWLVATQRKLTPTPGELGRVPPWLWALGGVLLGAGALGKYTMALAVPSGFLAFRLSGVPVRHWLGGYLAHGLVALAAFTPVVLYNWSRDFQPLQFQWQHAMAPAPSGKPWAATAGEFALVQIVLFGTWPFVLFPWALTKAKELSGDPRLRACLALYAVPFGFFVAKSFRGPLEGNWALVSYLSFWPLAAKWLAEACPRRLKGHALRIGFGAPAVVAIGLAIHLVWPLPPYPPKIDRINRQKIRAQLATRAADSIRAHGGGPVYTPTYQWVAFLRYNGVDARQMDGVSRPSHFTMTPDHLSDVDEALVWNETVLPASMAEGFGEPEVLDSFPLVVRGVPHSCYYLFRYRKSDARPEDRPIE